MNNRIMINIGSINSDVFEKLVKGCEKIQLDISKIRKIKKVYQSYGIPKEERIVAYLRSLIPLIPVDKDGVIFTNRAFYVRTSSPKKRFLYTELCEFIVVQYDTKGKVFVISETDSLCIVDWTYFKENIVGKEMVKILNGIQNTLCQVDFEANNRRYALAKHLCEKAKCEFYRGALSTELCELVKRLVYIDEIADESASIYAEVLFRDINIDGYFDFVNQVSGLLSESTRGELQKMPDAFFGRYIKNLKSFETPMQVKTLIDYYDRIERITDKKLLRRFKELQGYIAARIVKRDELANIIQFLREEISGESADALMIFSKRVEGSLMYKAFLKIKDNTANPEDFLIFKDNLELTVLHYAIILHNETFISSIFDSEGVKTIPFDNYLKDYAMIACGLGLSETVIEIILENTHSGIIEITATEQELIKKCKNLERQIKVMNVTASVTENIYSAGVRNDADPDDLDNLADKMDDFYDKMQISQEKLEQMREDLAYLWIEKQKMIDQAILEKKDKWNAFLQSCTPLHRYIQKMLLDAEYLEKILKAITIASEEELVLQRNGDFVFAVPAFVNFDKIIDK